MSNLALGPMTAMSAMVNHQIKKENTKKKLVLNIRICCILTIQPMWPAKSVEMTNVHMWFNFVIVVLTETAIFNKFFFPSLHKYKYPRVSATKRLEE